MTNRTATERRTNDRRVSSALARRADERTQTIALQDSNPLAAGLAERLEDPTYRRDLQRSLNDYFWSNPMIPDHLRPKPYTWGTAHAIGAMRDRRRRKVAA